MDVRRGRLRAPFIAEYFTGRGLACTATVLALLTGCRERTPTPAELPIVAGDYSFALPDSVPAGLVRVTLFNGGHDLHEAMLTRFTNAGGNASAYADSVRAHVSFPANAVDVGGAALTEPGDSSAIWLLLGAGHYAVVCWKGDHLSRGMVHDLIVTPSARPPGPPRATNELVLQDYSYRLKAPLTSRRQVLHVHNAGREAHEADIIRVTDHAGLAEYIAWLDAGEVGLPPAAPVAGIGDIAPGQDVWLELRLAPGRYVIHCTVRAADGRPHYRLGMVKEFVIQ